MQHLNETISNTEIIAQESFSTEDIIGIFKKTIELKEDGSYSTFEDIQEALGIFIAHMGVISPQYTIFIQSVLHSYTNTLMTAVDKDQYIGLQGYIRYIEIHVMEPLEGMLKKQKQEDLSCEFPEIIEKLRKYIFVAYDVIRELKKLQTEMQRLSQFPQTEKSKKILIQTQNKCAELIQTTESTLQLSEDDLKKLMYRKK